MVVDPHEPIPSIGSDAASGGARQRFGFSVGLAVAAVVEAAWLLFLGWMAIRRT